MSDSVKVAIISAIGLVLVAIIGIIGGILIKKANEIGVSVDGNLRELNLELKEATAALLASAKQASRTEGELLRTDQQRDMQLEEKRRQEERQDRKDAR